MQTLSAFDFIHDISAYISRIEHNAVCNRRVLLAVRGECEGSDWIKIPMTTELNPSPSDAGSHNVNDDEKTRKEIAFLAACCRFSAALTTLRTALTAADTAPGVVFFLEGECTPEKARDLHARWAAASCVMHEAVDAIVEHGGALLDAIQALVRS